MSNLIPVLTIDGPSGSGKGSISKRIAEKLGWRYLDSGALYRALGVAAIRSKVDLKNEDALADLVRDIELEFKRTELGNWSVLLNGQEVQNELQTEQVGDVASKIAVFKRVRDGLLAKQQSFLKPPGLVADGRDMGSVVFPTATHKVYLTANAAERGKRRYKQLIEKGISANLTDVIQDIERRDERDKNRRASPLVVPTDAVYIDSSLCTIEEVVQQVLNLLKNK
ncbi:MULTISPECIES: (d)CMP kinase [Cycloclasticus]|jgi:cytidylate kinase|uniref:Cytidylate kinase n=1 Tax=Cycloclasticus pugetii TaxID=34068 RepID=A0AB33Z3Z6_9GAMM|nr:MULTISPECIES: (d)CMP kinase [Cycloclasticus]ATI03640.1 (d)CMP kinase [Cycloclasticus sp. PY97N]EPD14129.1 cytidylate kinase [Cycloclasticus pugetii]PHR51953.1 MAG: (d)CMP kinase [Cycloclasticus sp.]